MTTPETATEVWRIFDDHPDGFAQVSMDGTVQRANPAFCAMLGYAPDELRGMDFRQFTPARWHAHEARIIGEQVLPHGHSDVYQKEYRRKDGTVFPVELRAILIREEERPVGIWAIVRDISDREQTHALGQAKDRGDALEAAIEALPISVLVIEVDVGGVPRILTYNAAYRQIVAEPPAERTPMQDLRHRIFAPDRVTPVPPLQWPGPRAALSGKPVRDAELHLRRSDGSWRILIASANPIPPSGPDAPRRAVAVLLDVTEARALQAQLQVAGRLAALGTLVAGIGHEINNPLTAAMASDEAAMDDLVDLRRMVGGDAPLDREAVSRQLEEILDTVGTAMAGDKRIAGIVADLAMLARPDVRRERVRVMDVVDQALRWLHGSVSRSATIQVENLGPPDVAGTPGQLAQVIINLVSNAAKAMPEGHKGAVTIRVGPGQEGMARVEVIDDGPGMSPGLLQRIFDPFFTTRAAGQGTGLGLAICHSIVTAHGGTMGVDSEPGKGSTFTVELPVAGPAAPTSPR